MRYTINAGGIRESEAGEYATWSDAKKVWIDRCNAAKAKMAPERQALQERANSGVTVAPISTPNHRNSWNDEPPADA